MYGFISTTLLFIISDPCAFTVSYLFSHFLRSEGLWCYSYVYLAFSNLSPVRDVYLIIFTLFSTGTPDRTEHIFTTISWKVSYLSWFSHLFLPGCPCLLIFVIKFRPEVPACLYFTFIWASMHCIFIYLVHNSHLCRYIPHVLMQKFLITEYNSEMDWRLLASTASRIILHRYATWWLT